ncbi:flagellar basal-body rod protein FlgF [Paenibacillus sp. J31TS4]|uniref:flagellar hook-basal body protein n=1 Tax=Paenibacillus sp. J31TS4 TaxID=2807195 RepID=UPI001B1ADB20|nr:flagellar hook-basal body protein [Paenibacillus sp. J31TS4]GIP40963.1 flagellar basal-body rod protein FlgF [Paenibacillus sp. J31TS4]
MNHSMISAMVSMNAMQQKLDVIANNMANVKTVGYKKKEASFEDILTSRQQQPPLFQREGRLSPAGLNQSWGVRLGGIQMNLTPGPLESTGNETDIAIAGDGVFELVRTYTDANGNKVNESMYTRDGAFQLGINPADPDNLYLASAEGYWVRGTDDQPIRIPKGFKMAVDEEGRVTAQNPADPTAPERDAGVIKVQRVLRPQYLQEIGNNKYGLPAGVAAGNVLQDGYTDNNGRAVKNVLQQGYLEQSNVDLSTEMTELMTVQRAFQLSSRAVSSSDTMMQLANNLRG